MDPFSAVIAALASSAVRSLVGGHRPNADEWASLSTTLLGALLAEQETTSGTLRRIEQKLDRLVAQDYEHSLSTALGLLHEAQPSWRRLNERDELLNQARSLLVRAAAAARGDHQARALAELHLAATYLLLQSVPDALRALDRADGAVFRALSGALDLAQRPGLDAVERRANELRGGLGRLLYGAVGVDVASSRDRAFEELRAARKDEAILVIPLLNVIQRMRIGLGVDPELCPHSPEVTDDYKYKWQVCAVITTGGERMRIGDVIFQLRSVRWWDRGALDALVAIESLTPDLPVLRFECVRTLLHARPSHAQVRSSRAGATDADYKETPVPSPVLADPGFSDSVAIPKDRSSVGWVRVIQSAQAGFDVPRELLVESETLPHVKLRFAVDPPDGRS